MKKHTKLCPICRSKDMKYPAVSRYDNKTEVCPECGMAEAFNGGLILTCRKLNLNFEAFAGVMESSGLHNPLYLAISKASKQAMKHFKPTKP